MNALSSQKAVFASVGGCISLPMTKCRWMPFDVLAAIERRHLLEVYRMVI